MLILILGMLFQLFGANVTRADLLTCEDFRPGTSSSSFLHSLGRFSIKTSKCAAWYEMPGDIWRHLAMDQLPPRNIRVHWVVHSWSLESLDQLESWLEPFTLALPLFLVAFLFRLFIRLEQSCLVSLISWRFSQYAFRGVLSLFCTLFISV